MASHQDRTPARVRVIRDGMAAHLPDVDPDETAEWLESFDSAVLSGGGCSLLKTAGPDLFVWVCGRAPARPASACHP